MSLEKGSSTVWKGSSEWHSDRLGVTADLNLSPPDRALSLAPSPLHWLVFSLSLLPYTDLPGLTQLTLCLSQCDHSWHTAMEDLRTIVAAAALHRLAGWQYLPKHCTLQHGRRCRNIEHKAFDSLARSLGGPLARSLHKAGQRVGGARRSYKALDRTEAWEVTPDFLFIHSTALWHKAYSMHLYQPIPIHPALHSVKMRDCR